MIPSDDRRAGSSRPHILAARRRLAKGQPRRGAADAHRRGASCTVIDACAPNVEHGARHPALSRITIAATARFGLPATATDLPCR